MSIYPRMPVVSGWDCGFRNTGQVRPILIRLPLIYYTRYTDGIGSIYRMNMATHETEDIYSETGVTAYYVLKEYANNNHILIVSAHDSLLADQARKNLCMGY